MVFSNSGGEPSSSFRSSSLLFPRSPSGTRTPNDRRGNGEGSLPAHVVAELDSVLAQLRRIAETQVRRMAGAEIEHATLARENRFDVEADFVN